VVASPAEKVTDVTTTSAGEETVSATKNACIQATSSTTNYEASKLWGRDREEETWRQKEEQAREVGGRRAQVGHLSDECVNVNLHCLVPSKIF
jgi:hypothetical protein